MYGNIRNVCVNAIMYADDLLLLSISLADMQEMINLRTSEPLAGDLFENVSKFLCLQFGPCPEISSCILSHSGQQLSWSKELKFLGFILSSRPSFKCKLPINKQKFF